MADNTTLNAGTGGDVIATDDIGGVKYPVGKTAWGAADTANQVDDATGKRLPVKVGEALPAGSAVIGGVTMAAAAQADGHSTTLGLTTDAAAATDTSNVGLIALFKRLLQRVTTLLGQLPAALTAGGNLKVSLQESNAAQAVTDNSGSLTVDNAGTFATQVDGAALTSLQLIDDPVATTAAAIPTKGLAVSGTDGTLARVLKTDTSGELQIDVLTSALPTGAATETTLGTRLTESDFDTKTGALTEAAPATDTASSGINGRLQRLAQRLTSLLAVFPATIDTNSGNKSASTLRVVLATDQVQLTNKLLVTPDSVALPANQSVNAAQVGGTNTDTNSGVKSAGTLRVVIATDQPQLTNKLLVTPDANSTVVAAGDVAHDTGDSGNPVKIGAKAVNAEPAVVTANDRVNLIADLVGKLIIRPHANPENTLNGTTAAITDTTSTQVIAAQAASVRIYVTELIVTNSHATVGTFVKILDGSTILWEGYCAAAGGGFTQSFSVPLRGTAATALNAQCVTTGANVIVSANGYKGA